MNFSSESCSHEELQSIAEELGLTVAGASAFGWRQKSVGAPVVDSAGRRVWMRLIKAPPHKALGRQWEGERDAEKIAIPIKPKLLKVFDIDRGSIIYRVSLSEYVESRVCSDNQYIEELPKGVDAVWTGCLFEGLRELQRFGTDRVNTRQDLVTRRLTERWGDNISSRIDEWVIVHGDLHWENLTAPELHILDWEGWGVGPKGLDVAFLMAYSVLVPEAVKLLQRQFIHELRTPTGRLSVLFAVAELLRMIDVHGNHPHLRDGLLALSEQYL